MSSSFRDADNNSQNTNSLSAAAATTPATGPTPHKKFKKFTREVFDPSSQNPVTATQLAEYPWPPDDSHNSDLWMLQEQVVSYLSLKGN